MLIHGGGDALGVWSAVVDRLPEDVTSIAIDSHGRGYSDWGPRHRTMRQAAADFGRLLEIEGVPGPYVLVGHSLGGLIAQYFAHAFPDDVAGLVLVDPTPLDRLGRYERDDGAFYMARDRDLARDIAVPSVRKAGEPVESATEEFERTNDYANFTGLLSEENLARLTASTNHTRKRPPGAELNGFWNEELRDLHELHVPHWLGSRPVRLLYVPADYSGYPDAWFDSNSLTRQSAEAMTEASLLSYLEISEDSRAQTVVGGHHVQIEHPDLVIEAIAEVLEHVRNQDDVR
ncbi:MAG: alpha/beta hydrolase [Gemmatimonadetes bacterium]|nr:alpha/beta hydrolase [Gemmatimonadota bacterium]